MPHFIIEQGGALATSDDRQKAMQIAAQTGSDCGFITPTDIKTRISDCVDFHHLDGCSSFIHVTVRLLSGRSAAQKHALADSLVAQLVAQFDHVDSISVDVVDMDPAAYRKNIRARGST